MWTKIHDLLALPDERGLRDTIHLKEEAQRCYILEWLIPKFSCLWRNHHEVFRKLPKSSPKPWPLELQSRSKGKLKRVRKLSMAVWGHLLWFSENDSILCLSEHPQEFPLSTNQQATAEILYDTTLIFLPISQGIQILRMLLAEECPENYVF